MVFKVCCRERMKHGSYFDTPSGDEFDRVFPGFWDLKWQQKVQPQSGFLPMKTKKPSIQPKESVTPYGVHSQRRARESASST